MKLFYKVWAIGILCSSLILTACAGSPETYRLRSTDVSLSESGIIFGSMLNDNRGIRIRNLRTREEIPYNSASYFEMKLPPGTYEIVAFGDRNGNLIPNENGFHFEVETGKIKYIGTITTAYNFSLHLEEKGIDPNLGFTEIKSIKEYGHERPVKLFSSVTVASDPLFDLAIIDNSETVLSDFIKRNPNINISEIVTDYMQ